jgi:hypothetical protein
MNAPTHNESPLLQLERHFWRSAGESALYGQHLAADALHVFPGWGIVEREAVLAGVSEAEPWESFHIEDVRVVDLGDSAAALVYEARARRPGKDTYRAAVTSVYRRDERGWSLVLHQQTALPINGD